MPVERQPISLSQFAELLGLTPSRVIAVEVDRASSRVTVVLEPEAKETTNGATT